MSDSAVNLGAGSPDFSGMSLDELMFGTNDPLEISRRTRPSYSETGEAYRFQDGQQMPFIDEEGYRVNLGSDARSRGTEGMFYEQSLPRSSPYEGLAEPLTRRATPDFGSRPAELYMQEGGNPAIEEAGIMSALFNAPDKEALELIRKSGREGNPVSQTYYPEGSPTFEQRLEQEYGYPEVTRVISEAPEDVRNQRPRYDMPTFQELEDARAHVLASAQMAQEFGPETATSLGNFAEGIDALPIPFIGFASPEDVAMDKRNNAVGVSLLRKAGVNASLSEITKMVDQKVFDQLDRILDRGEYRPFKSPEGGIDVYFPRDEQGRFATSRSGYY